MSDWEQQMGTGSRKIAFFHFPQWFLEDLRTFESSLILTCPFDLFSAKNSLARVPESGLQKELKSFGVLHAETSNGPNGAHSGYAYQSWLAHFWYAKIQVADRDEGGGYQRKKWQDHDQFKLRKKNPECPDQHFFDT